MKVYCKDCMYLDSRSRNEWDMDKKECSHRNNIRDTDKYNWYDLMRGWENITLPSEINKNNNCKWYKDKHGSKIHIKIKDKYDKYKKQFYEL